VDDLGAAAGGTGADGGGGLDDHRGETAPDEFAGDGEADSTAADDDAVGDVNHRPASGARGAAASG
jgi:hypothetical protein